MESTRKRIGARAACFNGTILFAGGESRDGPIHKDGSLVSTSVSLLTLLILTSLRTIDRRKYPVIRAIVGSPLRFPVMPKKIVEASVFCVTGNAECEKDGDFSEPAGQCWRLGVGSQEVSWHTRTRIRIAAVNPANFTWLEKISRLPARFPIIPGTSGPPLGQLSGPPPIPSVS